MAAADTSTKSRRNTVIQARQTCEEIIGSVKTIQNGDADLTAEFLGDFRDKACRFLAAIEQINLPICDRLEYFRDFVVADDPSIHPFTPLGLPYSQDDCGAPDLALSLTRQWLQHMSHTRDQLDELARNAPAEAKRNPNGGRKKSPKTKKLWERLACIYGTALDSLRKDGLSLEEARSLVSSWSATKCLWEINDAFGHPYPSSSREAAALKKKITRSDPWKAIHNVSASRLLEDDEEKRLRRDESWATEIGIRPERSGQN